MTNPARSTIPLDVLQSTLDGIFIEIGNSLRISDKVPPKTLVANANARLRTTIPKAIETFHQALDEIETDIVRAKAVLLRDFEEARAKRIALENPPPEVVQSPVKHEPTAEVASPQEDIMADSDQPSPSPKLEDTSTLAQWVEPASLDPPKDINLGEPDIQKGAQGPSPPSSNEVNVKAEDVDLNKKTPDAVVNAVPTDASVDYLLDISLDNDNNSDPNLDFDYTDFSQLATDGGDTSQPQIDDLLSTFGNDAYFTTPSLHVAEKTEHTNNNTENKKDDLFEMVGGSAGDSLMDMSFLPAEESSFDELILHAGEENGSASGITDHDNFGMDFSQIT